MVAVVQHVSNTFSGNSGTLTLSSTGAGNALIVVASYNSTTDTDLQSITLGGSSAGWASQEYFIPTDVFDQIVWANYNIAGGQTSLVVTAPSGDGVSDMQVDVFEVSGGLTGVDVVSTWHEVDATSGSWSSNATPTTTQAVEFVLGFVNGYNNGGSNFTFTGPSSPWTNETQLSAATGVAQLVGYQVSSAKGNFTFSGTANTTGSNLYYGAGVVTFKTSAGITSSGSVAMPAMAIGGSMTVPQPVTSSGSVTMPAMGVHGSVAMPVTSSGSIRMPSFGVSGAEVQYPWTLNLCPNPSFETDLTGYSPIAGTVLAQDASQGYAGHASMTVETPGAVAGEGFYGPSVTVPANGLGSMSLYVMGPANATLTVSAASGSPTSVIASTNVILLGGDYQRVILSGLPLTAGQQMYVVVQTTVAQEMNFWADAVQYEMNSPAHAYIDGSFLTCQWEGTPQESISFLPYPYGTAAFGTMHLEGRATPIAVGEIFTTSAEGTMALSGTESGTVTVNPVGALSSFGIWTPADMDPAVSYAGYSNALAFTGHTGWARSYAMFSAPQKYTASGGQVLWNRAAYMAVGFDFKAVPGNGQQNLADVQVELMPVTPGTAPAPTAWTPPRQVATVIKPTRLNFCPNPSIEVSTQGWTPVGEAVLSQDSSVAVSGTCSLKVTLHASGDGTYIAIPDLILGDTYVVSASVQGGPGLEDVIIACSGVSTSSAQRGVPYGGNAILGIGYGQGPYGGVEANTADMPTGQWYQPSLVFTAAESTVILSFVSLPGSDVSYPTEFWVDAVLVEEGEVVSPYFDGSYGTDYSWETGSTSGLARSYFYDRNEVSAGAVSSVLAQHTPLGITSATPIFGQPYSQ